MKKLLLLLLLMPIAATAQAPARYDLPVLMTVPGQVPVGSLPPLLAVTNATIAVCQYPATLSSGMCTNTVTTYTDSTLATACPSTAQLTAPGTSVCISTTGLQGSFGFWYDSSVQTHLTYTVKTAWGTFGPYDILQDGGSGGSGTVSNFSSGNLAPLFTASVSNSTTTPALSFTQSTFSSHAFYGNNGASTATPTAALIGSSDWSPNAYVVGAGSAQVQTVTLDPAPTALVAGLEVRWLPIAANTGAQPTLNVNGLGAAVITKLGTTALVPNDLTTAAVADAIYDGTRWQLQNPQASGSLADGYALGLDFGGTDISNSDTTPSSGDCLGYDGTNILGVPCTLPTATAPGQIFTSTGAGTTYAVQPQVFYSQSADTIASIEAECSSACTYMVTQPQTMTLTANHTLSSNVNLVFSQGGEWTVNGSGYTLTIPTQVQGALSPHFAGTSAISLGAAQLSTPVEWFGAVGYATFAAAETGTDSTAAIQACLNAIIAGQCQLQAQFYRTTTALTVTKSYVGLQGPPIPRGGELNAGIVLTSATGDILDLTGTSGSFVIFNVFRNLALLRSTPDTGADAGFHGSFAGGTLIQYVHSTDSLYPFFLHAVPSYGGSGGLYNDSAEFCGNGNAAPTGTPIGFRLDSTDGNAENSLTIRDSTAANQCGSNIGMVGMELIGEAVNDVDIFNFNVAGEAYGAIVDYTGSGGLIGASDIQFINSTFDACAVSCFLIENLPTANTASMAISGGWINGLSATGPLIDVENSAGVSISHVQIGVRATSSSGPQGIYLHGSATENFAIVGNEIFNQNDAIEANGAGNGSIVGNAISNNGAALAQGIWLYNTSAISLAGNSFTGNWTTGIVLNSSSDNNYGLSTNTFASGVATQIADSGVGNWAVNGAVQSTGTMGGVLPNSASLTYNSGSNAFEIQGFGANTTSWPDFYLATRNSNETTNAFYLHCTYNSGAPICTFAGNVALDAQTTATSTTAVDSPGVTWSGNYWNGSASAIDTWSCQVEFNTSGGFTNPPSILDCGGSGSSGGHTFQVASASIANFNGAALGVYGSQAGGQYMALYPSTLATSGDNYGSPFLIFGTNVWSGSANLPDKIELATYPATGANPDITLKLTHPTGGTSGAINVDLTAANEVDANAISATTINNATIGAATGSANVWLGSDFPNTGSSNTAIGSEALKANTTGTTNTAIGNDSLIANTTGASNVAVGGISMEANTTGNENVAYGTESLNQNISGSDNVAIGEESGINEGGSVKLTSMSNSVFIGALTGSTTDGLTNDIVIGSSTEATSSNQVTLGNPSITSTILQGAVTAPSIAGSGTVTETVGSAAGTGATIAVATGFVADSLSGTLSLKTGTSPGTGVIATVNFPTRSNPPNCVLQMQSGGGSFTGLASSVTTTSLEFLAESAPTASSSYALIYVCFGN